MPRKRQFSLDKYYENKKVCVKEFENFILNGHKKTYIERTDKSELQEISDARKKLIELSLSNVAIEQNIGITWFKELQEEFCKPYFRAIGEFLKNERLFGIIYPSQKDLYSWTHYVPIYDVKVVILGQEPYHEPNQDHGLAFSVQKGVETPQCVQCIYNELIDDIPGFKAPDHGNLIGWASQGVLLLNTTLTVRAGKLHSHKGSWYTFTDTVIKWINNNLHNVVFILWGLKVQEKINLISDDTHLVLRAGHPNRMTGRTYFDGCCHFSKTNEYLKKHGKKEINWNYLP